MLKKIVTFCQKLKNDQSGSVMVFFCVFIAVLLVFALSAMNIGYVAKQKVELQNAADFASLSGATWEARAMNIEGLLNVTITASIVIEIVKCVLTGVPPTNIPPAWINVQLKAQRWIQEGFNRFYFGTGMTIVNAWQNRQAIAIPQPFKVPLYVYRYSFAKALSEGANKFKERSDARDEYYDSTRSNTDDVTAEREDKRPSLFSFEYTHTLAKDVLWPLFGPVPIFAGKTGDQWAKPPHIKFDITTLPDAETIKTQLRNFIRKIFKTSNSSLDTKFLSSLEEVLESYVHDIFTYDSVGFKRYVICLPHFDHTIRPTTELASMTLRIAPKVKLEVTPELAPVPLKHGDIVSGEADDDLINYGELFVGDSDVRWYDTEADKEFWLHQVRQFHLFSDDTKCYLSKIKITSYCAKRNRRGRCIDWDYIGLYPDRGSRNYETRPSRAQVATDLDAPLTDCSAYDYPTNPDKTLPLSKCHKRSWWYLSFSVTFDVLVKAYLDIDFSAILMAKYRGHIDNGQLGTKTNECVQKVVQSYWDEFEGRNLYVLCCKFSEPLLFGHPIMAYDADEARTTDELKEAGYYDFKNIKDGRRPVMFAYGPARHWQMGDEGLGTWPEYVGIHRDESKSPLPGEEGLPIYFTMDWFSVSHLKPERTETIRGKGYFEAIELGCKAVDLVKRILIQKFKHKDEDLGTEDLLALGKEVVLAVIEEAKKKAHVNIDTEHFLERQDDTDTLTTGECKEKHWPKHKDLPKDDLDCNLTIGERLKNWF